MANKMMVPKKLQSELTCLFCNCSFLPRQTEQDYCEECTRLGLKVKPKVIDEEKFRASPVPVGKPNRKLARKPMSLKPKKCRECEKQFTPKSGNSRICPECREKVNAGTESLEPVVVNATSLATNIVQ